MSFKQSLKLIFEFIGTFLLASGLNFSTKYNEDGSQVFSYLLYFFTLMSAVEISKYISGAYFNPAVLIGFYLIKSEEEKEKDQKITVLYLITEFLAVICACLFSYIFYRGNVYRLYVDEGIMPLNALLMEIFITFILVYTFMVQCKFLFNIKVIIIQKILIVMLFIQH